MREIHSSLYRLTVTTTAFRAGQSAARNVAGAGCSPNWALIRRHPSPEFIAGFNYEWREFIAPFLATTEQEV